MQDAKIDAVINSVIPNEPKTEQVAEPVATTEEAPEPEAQVEPSADSKPEPDAFPKKAVNALSRRDKQIGKLRAERQQLQAELEQLRSKIQAPQTQNNQVKDQDGSPKEADFDNAFDYLKAVAKYEAKQELATGQKQQREQEYETKQQQYLQQRTQAAADLSTKYVSEIADYQQVVSEYSDVLDALPEAVQIAFLEADDPAIAAYQLAKEGKLEDLFNMSPYQAAMMIAKAEERGIAASKQKPVTKAPAPIASAKGTGTANTGPSGKSSYSDLKKWLNE